MKTLICAAAVFMAVPVLQAAMFVGPWTAIFKGIDHALGTNAPGTIVTNNGVVLTNSNQQVVHCARVDLSEPGVQFFPTPRATNYIAESRETLSLSISNFINVYGVQLVVNANFFSPPDPTTEGAPCGVAGLLISGGQVVSAADNNGRNASLMFSTNKAPRINLNNRPPGEDTTGIYTAVTGSYPLLTNGVNVWAVFYDDFNNAYLDPEIHGVAPRTAFGLSQDQRYLFLMTIDGWQRGYSDGARDPETAMWLLQFGAWDAINMDGGGSTAMYVSDCGGTPTAVSHSSYANLLGYGRERFAGAHFGVYAQSLPVFINDVLAVPGQTTAAITWTTAAPASSQVEYGRTQTYGSASGLDPSKATTHRVTLNGLTPGTRYFYRVLCSDGTNQYSSACGVPFVTTNNQVVTMLFDVTNSWRFSTANLDGIDWQAPDYDDSGWDSGPGLLWADSRLSPNPNGVQFENTRMPLDPANNDYPFITYYFRAHFSYTNSLAGLTLIFSNYIDDGAVFYLNGVEVNRAYLPTPAFNGTLAAATNCATGDATCPYVFTVGGDMISNLQSGDNVVAVEVHNARANSPDVTFGQALLYVAPISKFGALTNRPTGSMIAWGTLATSMPGGRTNVVAVSAGGSHAAVLRSDGTVFGWGDNLYGQTTVPAGLSKVVAISAGGLHTLALKSDGTVAAWGYNYWGETNVPTGLSNVVAISAGDVHSLALRQDGTVVAWGGSSFFGEGRVPPNLGEAVAIAAGDAYSAALLSDGTVTTWGRAPPIGLSNVAAISAQCASDEQCSRKALALMSNGAVVAWGTTTNVSPVFPAGSSNYLIAAGCPYALAVNSYGRMVVSPSSSAVPDLQGVLGIASSYTYGLALVSNRRSFVTNLEDNDLVITLDPLASQITSLPAFGTLYQYDFFGPGEAITQVPTGVPDPGKQVLYSPLPDVNGEDGFFYQIGDGTTDGLAAYVAISTLSVNDAPSFTKGPDQVTFENSGRHILSSWATLISPGPTNESTEVVTLTVISNSNPGLFLPSQPSIAVVGTGGQLFYTTATNSFGVARITVVARDSGGTANGGQDTSAPQTFTITARPGPLRFQFMGGQPRFTLAAQPGQTCVVQASTNLINWITLGDYTAGPGGGIEFVDSSSPRPPTRFYRVDLP